jgi:maltoporin
MLVNGWDDAIDNNMSKSICEQISIVPAGGMNVSLTHMIGPEKDQNDVDYRNSFDLVGSDTICSNLSIGLNGDYSTEMHSASGNGTALWWGIGGYLKYRFSGDVSLAARVERFADVDGIRTGVRQNLRECTLTPELRLNSNILLRGDVRIDLSDKKVFQKVGSWTDTQPTLSANAIYFF